MSWLHGADTSLRILNDTVGIKTGIQLVVASSFAPVKDKPLSVLSVASQAFIPKGLKANPEWKGLILPIREGEIDSILTTASHITVGEISRHS